MTLSVGSVDGRSLEPSVGDCVAGAVGSVGSVDGRSLGLKEGTIVGCADGRHEEEVDDNELGNIVGSLLGLCDG